MAQPVTGSPIELKIIAGIILSQPDLTLFYTYEYNVSSLIDQVDKKHENKFIFRSENINC